MGRPSRVGRTGSGKALADRASSRAVGHLPEWQLAADEEAQAMAEAARSSTSVAVRRSTSTSTPTISTTVSSVVSVTATTRPIPATSRPTTTTIQATVLVPTAPTPVLAPTAPTPTTVEQHPPAGLPAGTPAGTRRIGVVTYYADPGGPGTCASPTLPFGTVVTVTNPANSESVRCTVDDREADTARQIDLDTASFAQIAPLSQGVILDAVLSW